MNFDVLLPPLLSVEQLNHESLLPYFSEIAINFVANLASALQKEAYLSSNSEMHAMAFWMRKAHLEGLKDRYAEKKPQILRAPQGTVFHIAPGNVDSIFFYSWFISLLCGNKNIVRISSKTVANIAPFLRILKQILLKEEFVDIAKRNLLVSYDHCDATTAFLSQNCQMRVIWGGDETIQHIRQIMLPPRAKELTFANKFSYAIINAEKYPETLSSQQDLIRNFYNDAYWFNQRACSSPRIVCWIGAEEKRIDAQKLFWQALEQYAHQQEHHISLADMSDKIFTIQALAMQEKAKPLNSSHLVSRVAITELTDLPKTWHCGGGLFFEYSTLRLPDIFQYFENDVQTIGYYGFEVATLQKNYQEILPSGGLRFVPIGQALTFHEIWDGYLLFDEFSKRVTFQ